MCAHPSPGAPPASPGDIVHLSSLGQSIIVIGSAEIASELLEKRATIYSDRLQPTMLLDL